MSSLARYVIREPKPLRWTGFIFVIIGTTIAMQWYINRGNSLMQLQLIAQLEYIQQNLEQRLNIQTLLNSELIDSIVALNVMLTDQRLCQLLKG